MAKMKKHSLNGNASICTTELDALVLINVFKSLILKKTKKTQETYLSDFKVIKYILYIMTGSILLDFGKVLKTWSP